MNHKPTTRARSYYVGEPATSNMLQVHNRALGEYLDDLRRTGEGPISSKNGAPVLLHVVEQVEYWTARSFRTLALSPHTRTETGGDRWTHPGVLVLPVTKRPGGAFPDRISVGRTAHSDVCLPYPKVSKLHAFFTKQDRSGSFELHDAMSTNGTSVNGERLARNGSRVLAEDCLVTFGRYEVRFLMPDAFLGHLKSLA